MEQNVVRSLDAGLGDALTNGLSKASAEQDRSRREIRPSEASPIAERLPRKIDGGFTGVSEDLDLRVRDWRNMTRILDQQRPQLEAAEVQYQAAYAALAATVPQVEETGRALSAMIATTKAGDVSEDLAGQFGRNLKTLEDLEAIAETLTNSMLQLRSSWDQYARSIIKAQKMRELVRSAS